MLVHVVNARYLDGYRILVTFNDGREGVADLQDSLQGPAFEQLRDVTVFQRFEVNKDLDTVVWENGADMAPEYIYFKAFANDPILHKQFKEWGYLAG